MYLQTSFPKTIELFLVRLSEIKYYRQTLNVFKIHFKMCKFCEAMKS